MSRSYWLGLFLIGGTLGFCALPTTGQAQDQPAQIQKEANRKQAPAYQLPFSVPVQIVEDRAAADTRERHEAEARQREIEGLIVQQGMNSATQAMNDATQRMADYTYWSTILVGIGTALLFITLALTRQANQAARDAVEVTRQMGVAQMRAYLSIEPDPSPNLLCIGKTPLAEFRIINKGSTPAYNVRHVADVRILDHPLPADPGELVLPPSNVVVPTVTLHAGTHYRAEATDEAPLSSADYMAVTRSDAKRAYLIVNIWYEDVFRQTRFTKFCAYAEATYLGKMPGGEGFGNIGWVASHAHNEAT